MKYIPQCKQGDTFRRVIELTYTTGAIVDLTGCTARSQLRSHPGAELIAEGDIDIDTDSGRITVSFTAEQTAEIDTGEYGFDVRLMIDGDVKTIYTEKICIVAPYTEIDEGGE